MPRVDIRKLKGDLREVAGKLHVLKKTLRTSGHQVTWEESATLRGLKQRATALCKFRAGLRGKVHGGKVESWGLRNWETEFPKIYEVRPAGIEPATAQILGLGALPLS